MRSGFQIACVADSPETTNSIYHGLLKATVKNDIGRGRGDTQSRISQPYIINK